MQDGGLETIQERLTWLAPIQVLFQFFAQRIIQLFIQIVGELREQHFAGRAPFLWHCSYRRVRQGVGFLASQREVIEMLKVAGMSLEEVARATSSTVGSVKQKVHRAYEKLRERMGGMGLRKGQSEDKL